MASTKQHRATIGGLSIGRVTASLIAVGGISAAVFLVSTAGAVSSQTSKSVVVSVVKNAKLGTILSSGRTLYTLNKTDCTAKCLKYWPAFTLPKGVTKVVAGSGVSAGKLGTVKAAGGARQVTYSGKPLYFFVEDTESRQVRGNKLTDPWGTWSVVVTTKPASSPSTAVVTTVPSATSTPTSDTSPASTSSPTATTAPAVTTTTAPPKQVTTTTAPSGGGIAF
jgi:predicted lipoprotein with Yx(FWY)xxD motif